MQLRRRAGQFQHSRFGFVVLRRGDPHAHELKLFFEDFLVEALFFEIESFVEFGLASEERDLPPVGAPIVAGDVCFVGQNVPGFAAVNRDHVERFVFVLTAFGEKRNAFAVERPLDRADVHLAGHEGPRMAVRVDDVKFAPSRAVLALERLARHAEHIGDPFPVR